ncbi:multidrug ABC transporter permease/ATP-binding protein [Helicobacter muridarum]|uniref:Multidrug ABC transporter permease/ATP-binding protein n=2 Tax=Helicobacter muridarum TaxID=216 RepID=A0A4U8TMQ7_9HELI|nr:multidrug ABC transporter permease/ATP-binding protein [Helicobacter muridarum]TLE01727.1 multidrug ABC transporter permease/ATP-binding protein [Helicobacter muridarum]
MDFIVSFLIRNKYKVLMFLFASVFTSLFGIGILAFINQYLLKSNISNNNIIWYFIIILIVFFLSSCLVEIILGYFGQSFIFTMQTRLVKQLLDTPLLRVHEIGKAKLLASLGNDVRTVSFGLLRLPDFIQSLVLIICTSFYLFYLSIQIFIISFVWIVIVFWINHYLMRNVYKNFKNSRDSDDSLQLNYQHIIDGHKELTLNRFRAKYYYDNDFIKNAHNKKISNVKSNIYQSISGNWGNTALLGLIGLEFYCALRFDWASLEDATTIALVILFLRTPLVTLVGNLPTLMIAKISLDKIRNLNLQDYKPDFTIPKQNIVWNNIRFENVSFSYNNAFSLKPTNIEIHRGELIFLIGKNGSGKSTFSMLLAGLIQPNEGRILLDSTPIVSDNIALYRNLISAIFSDFHLFTQILSRDSFADSKHVQEWLDILELDAKIGIYNNHVNTTKLSTGQRKRIAMLIALLEERDILILDEWAADQDPLFRRFFYEVLLPKLKAMGKTIFVISHDNLYFDITDRIFLAKNGEICEIIGDNVQEIAKNVVDKF